MQISTQIVWIREQSPTDLFTGIHLVNLLCANLVFSGSVKLQYFTEELIFTTLFSKFFTRFFLTTINHCEENCFASYA